ncbi:MAG: glycoside hydrolase family 97 N-terminal domain-containing protein, partial [Prevotella sp.]|nr:glycoside hydrolase family 97 N-terminal domain-containing protein [Prevotella sp.]
MKRFHFLIMSILLPSSLLAGDVKVVSPDGNLVVTVTDNGGAPRYSIAYGGVTMMEPSALGLVTDYA